MASTYRGSREKLYLRLAMLPAQLAGRLPDTTGTVDRLWRAVGVEALSIVREAFLAKARGGTDDTGLQWDPLKPETIAYKRRHPGLNRRRGYAAKAGRGSRPLLTASQDILWRRIYRSKLLSARRAGMSAKDAASNAAALAWGILKTAGAQTILGKYGTATVEIGRDTGRLFASLSPGSTNNILDVRGPGRITVGTNVTYAGYFHKKRPLWPEEDLPPAWETRLLGVLADGVKDVVARLVEDIANGG